MTIAGRGRRKSAGTSTRQGCPNLHQFIFSDHYPFSDLHQVLHISTSQSWPVRVTTALTVHVDGGWESRLVKQRRSGFAFLRKPHQMGSIPSRDHDSRIQACTGRYREEDRNFELVDLFSDQLIKPWTDSSWQKVFTEKTHAAQAYFRHHGK